MLFCKRIFGKRKWNSVIDNKVNTLTYDEILDINKVKLNVSRDEIEKWLNNGGLSEFAATDYIHKKGLEFFFSCKILEINQNDVVMDAAGGNSGYLNAVKKIP